MEIVKETLFWRVRAQEFLCQICSMNAFSGMDDDCKAAKLFLWWKGLQPVGCGRRWLGVLCPAGSALSCCLEWGSTAGSYTLQTSRCFSSFYHTCVCSQVDKQVVNNYQQAGLLRPVPPWASIGCIHILGVITLGHEVKQIQHIVSVSLIWVTATWVQVSS